MDDEPVPNSTDQIDKPGTWIGADAVAMSPSQKRSSLVAAAVLFIGGLITLEDFLPALGWAGIFAIALWPLYDRLVRRWPRHSRGLIPTALVALVLLMFIVPLLLIAVPLVADAHAVGKWLQQVAQSGIRAPAALADLPHGDQLTKLWQAHLGQPGSLQAMVQRAAQGDSGGMGRKIAGNVIHRIMLAGFMLLALLFLLRDLPTVVEGLRIGSRRAFGPAGKSVGRQLIRAVKGTVNGLVFVGIGEGVTLGVAYVIAGVIHPTLFALLTALLAMVPFGAAFALCAAAIALVATGKTVAAIVIVVVGFGITFVADHFVRPVLIEGATRLPFLWVLLGILGGVEAWGLIGLVMGPAIVAALMLLWREWIGAQKGPLNPTDMLARKA